MSFLKNISPNNATDKELVSAFKQSGQINYLSVLYQRYMDQVLGICLKYFKDMEKSKDAVMDIFEELHHKLKQHEVENFKGWLHVLAKNHCLMHLRSPRNLKTSEFNPAVMQTDHELHPSDEHFEKEENYLQLEQCIQTLPEAQRQSIELFYLQNKCYKEITIITGYEWDKVRSHIQNGKRNLKICMEEKTAKAATQKTTIFK